MYNIEVGWIWAFGPLKYKANGNEIEKHHWIRHKTIGVYSNGVLLNCIKIA